MTDFPTPEETTFTVKYVDDALEQGWVSTGGAYITQLEKNMEHLPLEGVPPIPNL